MTFYSVPSKRKIQTNTLSLRMLEQVLQFLTDVNTQPQSASVDHVEIRSGTVSISAFSISVMPAIMQNSGMKGTNGPLRLSMNWKSVNSICGARVSNASDTVRTGTSSPSAFLSSTLVIRYDRASDSWCCIPVRQTMSKSNSEISNATTPAFFLPRPR